ncbi:endothelin-converting enzyme 1-like isoform X2 [Paramacrobiotus metropolitanus]|uniref:endothelin-converting enzyme 1-like isoform X2 n=1 Tax=Paramacrobiotus metropolitanus TaxID=2943436 RepID=UPI0024460C7E|nr:endothelin-converting enzyme 1-like isoform X2 [Paramacrobiotus metropolitanus]
MFLWDAVRLLLTASAIRIAQVTGRQPLSTPACRSDLCQNVAHEIVSSMDDTIDPCTDFYAYACGRWNVSDPYDRDQSGVLKAKISVQLQELFDNGSYTNPTEKKASDIYNQCIRQANDQPFDDRSLVGAVDDLLGGWSLLEHHRNVSAFRLDDALVRLQLNNIVVYGSLPVSRNVFSSDENILFFVKPYRLSWLWEMEALINGHGNLTVSYLTAQLMNKWTPIVQRLLKATNASADWSTVKNRLEQAIRLDVSLAVGRVEFNTVRTSKDIQMRLTFGDLSRPPYRSRFLASFLSLFNTMLKASSVKFQATTTTTFGAPNSEYIIQLDRKMAQLEWDGDAGRTVLADWLWWISVYHYHLAYRGKGTCVKLVKAAMPLTVSGMFFKTYIPSEAVEKAKVLAFEIANGVRDAVLLKATWMDRATQDAAVDKLNHTLLVIGYPEEFLHDSTLIDDLYAKVHVEVSFFDTLRTIDRSNSWINLRKLSHTAASDDPFYPTDLTLLSAVMLPESNRIVIPAAYLQPPTFYASNMDIINYARFGSMIGHEFTHGFDILGKEFGKDGKLFSLWTNATQNNYNTKKHTLVDFYNNISPKNDSVDGLQTLGENIADISGYRASYLAFRNFLRRTKFRIKLPGLEALNEEQLFWLIEAQTYCTRHPASLDTAHAPNRYRVMGSYMNNVDFGAAYNCSLGSPMNPRIKGW